MGKNMYFCTQKNDTTMKKALPLIVLLALSGTILSQQMRLTPKTSRNTLYLDLDRIYDYNLYEQSRWGFGLTYEIPLFPQSVANIPKNSTITPRSTYSHLLSLSGYVAWGYADHRWKYGLTASLRGITDKLPLTYLLYFHDLTRDADRTMGTLDIGDLMLSTSHFMSSSFSSTHRIAFGNSCLVTRKLRLGVDVRLSDERRLYGIGVSYPDDDLWPLLPRTRLAEGAFSAIYGNGMLRGEVTLGYFEYLKEYYPLTTSGFFARAMAQYEEKYIMGPFYLRPYVQTGITSAQAPLSRTFDLGGTWGSPLLLGRAMVTARPAEFVANAYAISVVRFGFENPIFNLYSQLFQVGLAPRPFIHLGAMWGSITQDGALDIYGVSAPDKGFFEAGVGIDGLVQWGAVDWGIGVAYRMVPSDAPYCLSGTTSNLALLFTATLNSDMIKNFK